MSDTISKWEESQTRFVDTGELKKYEKLKMHDNTNYIAWFEEEYPVLAKEFVKIQAEQYELFAKKHLSYGMGNISMGSNLETKEEVKFSLTSIWIRMNDKMNRLKNLVIMGNDNPLDNEPIMDSWQDITNYGIIAQLVSQGKWKK